MAAGFARPQPAPSQAGVPQAAPWRTALLIVPLNSFYKSQQCRNVQTFTGHCTSGFCHILVLLLYTYSTACRKPLHRQGNLHPCTGRPKMELLPQGCPIARAHSGQFNQSSALSLPGHYRGVMPTGAEPGIPLLCSPQSLLEGFVGQRPSQRCSGGSGSSLRRGGVSTFLLLLPQWQPQLPATMSSYCLRTTFSSSSK